MITATNKGLKQYEKNNATREERKRRKMITNVKALFTHTSTISSFEKGMQKKAQTHIFLHFFMLNGALEESTYLMILIHGEFAMLITISI